LFFFAFLIIIAKFVQESKRSVRNEITERIAMEMVLADPQGITRMGLMYLLHEMGQDSPRYVEDKAGLIERLKECPAEIIILDYNLFDFYDANEMFILSQRFSKTLWLLFSEELSVEFMKMVMLNGQQFSIIMKDSPLSEIREALRFVMHGKRFICQHAMEMLLEEQSSDSHPEMVNLTKTEQEILKDIALGMTTKEIAAKRFSSFHTVNTHRKNIFRKLGVNNVHEATKYALRAGLVDAAEYYI